MPKIYHLPDISFDHEKITKTDLDHSQNYCAQKLSEQAESCLEEAFRKSQIVRKDARSAKYDAAAEEGEICHLTYDQARQYCQEVGGHLPSTRDFANFMKANGIIEADYAEKVLHGHLPPGYYKVDCQDKDGYVDSFYFNNEGVRKLEGDLARNSFWTSSLVKGNDKYAHVFYGPLGGGGGPKEEHERNFRHAVLFLPGIEK